MTRDVNAAVRCLRNEARNASLLDALEEVPAVVGVLADFVRFAKSRKHDSSFLLHLQERRLFRAAYLSAGIIFMILYYNHNIYHIDRVYGFYVPHSLAGTTPY